MNANMYAARVRVRQISKGHQHVRVLLGLSVGRVNKTKTRVVLWVRLMMNKC